MLIDVRMINMSIINNLTSTSTQDPLSAYMGKVLNETKLDSTLSSYELIVDPTNGVSAGQADGTAAKPFLTISDAYGSLPDLGNNVTLRLKSGTYTEAGALDLYKNMLTLKIEPYSDSDNVVLSGFALTASSAQKVILKNLSFNINNNAITDALSLKNVNFEINGCSFANCTNAIKTIRASGLITQCSFDDVSGSAIFVNDMSLVLIDSCTTVDNVATGITCNGSIVVRYGNALIADTEYVTYRNGMVFAAGGQFAGINMFDIAKAYNDANNYVWPNENAIGDTRSTEEVWLQSMTAYGSYTRYATNASLTVMSETDFWQTALDVYTHPMYTSTTGAESSNQTPAFGGTFNVSQVTSDTTGHITGQTTRTVTIPNDTVIASENGSGGSNGLMPATDKEKLNGIADKATKDSASSTTPKANGTATAGSEASYARGDHVHPLQTTISGNAGTATSLETARTIDGVSFNGSSAISHYGECSTAAATTTKTVSCNGFTLVAGAWIAVRMTVTNTGAVSSLSLDVNSTGAKAIKYRNANLPDASTLTAGRTYLFVYDGTYYQLIGDLDTDTTYSAATQSADGLMSSTDKTKLDGVDDNANNYSHPTTSGNRHIPSGGSSLQILRWSADGTATWGDESAMVTYISNS